MCNGAIEVAKECNAKIIIALTNKGFSAKMISRYKPEQKILALTPKISTRNQLSLSYGCVSFVCKKFGEIIPAIKEAKALALKSGLGIKGDKIVVIFGFPLGEVIGTNTLMVETL